MDYPDRVTIESFYHDSERHHRISVDIDGKKQGLFMLATFFKLRSKFPKCKVLVDKTKHGYHVKVVGRAIEHIPVEKRISIRESLCDDSYRLDFDRFKLSIGQYYKVDTLFTMKRDFNRKLSKVESINPIALPWASQLPSKKPTACHTSF